MKWFVCYGEDAKGTYTEEHLMSANHRELPRKQRWEEFNLSYGYRNKKYD